MNYIRNLFIVIFVLVFTHHSGQVSANPLSNMDAQKGSIDGGTLAIMLLSSFIIGNSVAWAMGAYPRDFPVQPYSQLEKEMIKDLSLEIEENPDEPEVMVELGELYFQHNELDKADSLLERAVKLEPDNAEALVISSANGAKQAGAMWDFTWGIRKLSKMDDVVSGLNRAVEIDPDNYKVRLYRMNVLLGFRNKKDNFHKIFEDEEWFLSKQKASPNAFPEEVNREFYQTLGKAYEINAELADSSEKKAKNLEKSRVYRMKITPISTID